MKKLSKREQKLLIVFFIILIAVIGIEYLLFPSLEKAEQLEIERANLQLQWDDVQAYSGSENQLKTQIEQLNEKTESLEGQLPSIQDSHLYWEFINESAKKTGVEVIQLQEGELHSKGNYRLVNLSLSGSFEQTKAFIETLNTMPYVNAISEGSLQKNNQQGLSTTLNLYISAIQERSIEEDNENQTEAKIEESSRNPFK